MLLIGLDLLVIEEQGESAVLLHFVKKTLRSGEWLILQVFCVCIAAHLQYTKFFPWGILLKSHTFAAKIRTCVLLPIERKAIYHPLN